MTNLSSMHYDSPRNYGVPHDEWRPSQYQMFKSIENVMHKGGGFVVGELGTGSGKSTISCAMGKDDKVLVVVHTLALLDQYRDAYGFSVVKGRQEYSCVLDEKVSVWKQIYQIEPTAADCTYSPMWDCEVSDACPYLNARTHAFNAQRSACTYRYIGVSRMMREREGNIVLDEAHDAVEELIRFNEFIYLAKTLNRYKLPKFPITTYGEQGGGAVLTEKGKGQVAQWLSECVSSLSVAGRDKNDRKVIRQIRVRDRFKRMLDDLYTVDWFLQVNHFQISLKALDAVAIANQIFMYKSTKLLMSATIGNPEPLTKALGITDYEFLTFDHPVPPKFRSIKDLGMDRMTARNLKERPSLYKTQAMAIWNWIMKMPPSWRGVILTTSYKKIGELYRHLLVPAQIVPQPRRLISQKKGESVSKLIEQFTTDVKPSDIMIGTIQGWGSGLDLRGELARWVVIAGVPHKNPTDQYAKARRQQAGGMAYQRWVVYNTVMQACGRVSRGEYNEYGYDWLPNYAAIADGSALSPTAKKYYGEWFLSALI